MSLTIAVDPFPIQQDEHGVLRIGGTRVTLDTVLAAYFDGASPEEIALRYDALHLADIHATIAYYLRHQSEVDQYLQSRREYAKEVRATVLQQQGVQQIRERLMSRTKQ